MAKSTKKSKTREQVNMDTMTQLARMACGGDLEMLSKNAKTGKSKRQNAEDTFTELARMACGNDQDMLTEVDKFLSDPTAMAALDEVVGNFMGTDKKGPGKKKDGRKGQQKEQENKLRKIELKDVDTHRKISLSLLDSPLAPGCSLVGLNRTMSERMEGTGATLWPAAQVQVQYFADPKSWPDDAFVGCSVCELGAGLGATGIYLALRGAQVVLTDLDSALPLLRANADANCGKADANGDWVLPGGGRLRVEELRWGQHDAFVNRHGTFDFVVASEVTFDEELYPILFDTIEALIRPGRCSDSRCGRAIVAASRRLDEIDCVERALKQRGVKWRCHLQDHTTGLEEILILELIWPSLKLATTPQECEPDAEVKSSDSVTVDETGDKVTVRFCVPEGVEAMDPEQCNIFMSPLAIAVEFGSEGAIARREVDLPFEIDCDSGPRCRFDRKSGALVVRAVRCS